MRKLTTQEFIDRARTVHGDKYSYALSVYKSARENILIHCQKHGVFEQRPNDHLNRRGCPTCGGKHQNNKNSFIKKAVRIHGNKYSYSLVDYVNNSTRVKIVCQIHGVFEQTPDSHVNRKSNCPACVGKKLHTNNSFIEKAKKVHGENTYHYTLVQYVNVMTKVKITCPTHGDFEQTPGNHLSGQGCPGCATGGGFDRTKKGFLYILRSECGKYIKIGVTHKPSKRHSQLSRVTPFSFKCIELIEGPGEQIANLEKELLAKYQPAGFTETFDGYSEWRLWSESIRHKLISFMDKELTNGPL